MKMNMEKQKNKVKNTPDRMPVLKFSIFGILAVAVIIVVLLMLGPIIPIEFSRIDQTLLPDEFYPTAEAILNTVPIGERIPTTDDVFLHLIVYDGGTSRGSSHRICIFSSEVLLNSGYINNSRIFVNGSRVWGSFEYPTMSGLDSSQEYIPVSTSIDKCIHGNLEPGLHLIEFHLRDSFFGEPLAIQQWAIEVE